MEKSLRKLQEPLICQYSSKVLFCQGENLPPAVRDVDFADRLNYAVLCMSAAYASGLRLALHSAADFGLDDLVEPVNFHCDYEGELSLYPEGFERVGRFALIDLSKGIRP